MCKIVRVIVWRPLKFLLRSIQKFAGFCFSHVCNIVRVFFFGLLIFQPRQIKNFAGACFSYAHETVKEMISRVGYMTSLFFGVIRTKIMCWGREKPERYIFDGCNTRKALLSLTVQEKEQEGAHMTGGLSIEMIYVGKNYFGNHTFKSHETGFPFIQWVPKCGVCAALLSFKCIKEYVQHKRDVQDEERLKHSLDELALKIELPVQPLGIPNLINKCYMNSLLQILCWTPLITSQLAKQLQRQGEREGKMSMSILRLLDHHYSNIGKRTVDKGIAENIIKAARHANPQFEGNNQEDSFEMFNTILSTIEEEARQNFEIMDEETGQGEEESFRNLPVSRLFGGEIVTIWSYDSCKCEDRNTQRFTSIPLTVNEETEENDKGHSVNKYTDVEKGLHQMLSSVEEFDEELLGCRRCEPDRQKNGKARGIKRVSIAPPVLVLQLNRAVINEAAGKLEKIERKLTYPEVFDLAQFCKTDTKEPQEPVLYSLYGIVNHIGSISSGHYFAYIKTKKRNVNFILEHLEGSSRDKLDQVDKDSEWYYVSDTTVKQCKEDNALNSGGAYILMYERTDKRQE